MIEETVYGFLASVLEVPVYPEEPEKPPARYVRFEKTGSGMADHIRSATVAVQSYGETLLDAAQISGEVVEAMLYGLPGLADVCGCRLNTESNFTDIQTNRHRYQAVFEITHY